MKQRRWLGKQRETKDVSERINMRRKDSARDNDGKKVSTGIRFYFAFRSLPLFLLLLLWYTLAVKCTLYILPISMVWTAERERERENFCCQCWLLRCSTNRLTLRMKFKLQKQQPQTKRKRKREINSRRSRLVYVPGLELLKLSMPPAKISSLRRKTDCHLISCYCYCERVFYVVQIGALHAHGTAHAHHTYDFIMRRFDAVRHADLYGKTDLVCAGLISPLIFD